MLSSLQFEDVEIEYFRSGTIKSETILFVHGLGADLSQFENQHEFFGKSFQVLSVNLRGHGNSRILQTVTPSDFELAKMANDIVRLLDTLNINAVHYVGNSMGGTVAYQILKTKPVILKSITTFGATAQLHTSKFQKVVMLFLYHILSPKALAHLAKKAGQTKASKRKIQQMMCRMQTSTLRYCVPHLANFDYLGIIKNSRVPCMILKGEKDKSINKVIRNTVLEFEARGRFTLRSMNEAGHFANLDDPPLFNKILEETLLDHFLSH